MGLSSSFAGLFGRACRATAALASALVLAGCSVGGNQLATPGATPQASPLSAPPSALDKRSPVKVVMILPLSGGGQTEIIAKAMKQAGEMALFEFDNPAVQLIVKDGKGTPEGSRAAAEEAVKVGAELIIGPLFAKSVAAVTPVARKANIPVIAFSSDRAVATRGTYLLSFIPGTDVPRIVSYASQQGRKRFAALIPDDAYGRLIESEFRQSVTRSGGTVVTVSHFPVTANAMLDPVKRTKEAIDAAQAAGQPIDALFLPAGEESLPTIASLLKFKAIDTRSIKLLGLGGWNYANAGREPVLLGGWYAAPDPRGWHDFAQRFARTYKGVPPRIASVAFDAVSLALALSGGPAGNRYTEANLTRTSGFAGIDGLFRFQPSGLVERNFAVLEVQSFGSKLLDAPPSTFAAAPYTSALPRLPRLPGVN